MKVTVLAAGKIKERFFTEAVFEYKKRLSKYLTLEINEIKDEKTPYNPTEKERSIILDKEAARFLEHIQKDTYVIALAIEGRALSSEELADTIKRLGINGISNITFVIGGSLGLSDKISKRADLKLSFSKMTFPHQLMRVILLEQLYRSERIINNEPYHK